MKIILTYLLIFLTSFAFAQTDSLAAIQEVNNFQREHNAEYKDPNRSPLYSTRDFTRFKSHDFYPVDLSYRVTAKLEITNGTPFFQMKTTGVKPAFQRIYGHLLFNLQGKAFRVPVYQSQHLVNVEGYTNYLFFPFTDLTNGKETYGGGRYIDLRIPENGDQVIIDFNKAYNPYCAYSSQFSCPVVPAENNIDIPVRAGVRFPFLREAGVSDNQIYFVNEQPAEYRGGLAAMKKFLSENVQLPKEVKKGKLEGKVYVQFVIATDGTVGEVKVLKGLSAECDQEALRLISLMPVWKPAKKDGKSVTSQFVLPVVFSREGENTKKK